MNPLFIIFGVVILVVVTWKLRGKYDLQKNVEFQEKRRRANNSAKMFITWLWESNKEPLAVKPGTPNNDDWNNLIKLRQERGKVLDELGFTAAEIDAMERNYQMRVEWSSLMEDLKTTNYSEETFDYCLKKRNELLEENRKTLFDFGVTHDDTGELRSAFFIRLAKHSGSEALQHISKAEKCLRTLRSERSTLPFKDEDFGITEVKRRLNQLLTLK
jgi:hypothetical protein